MKYTNEQYAEALFRAANEKAAAKQKEILRNFLLLLSRKGDFYRLPLVVQKFEKKYRAYNGINKVRVECPDGITSVVKKQIEKILGKKIVWEEKINPALLGGIKIIVNDDILVDATAKRQLDKIMPRSKV
ncbi:MAG: F0F1 ATP synthase subunit delta [bacterium]|nr:F0F1 ATP synthase subunit delta [bacterium]